MYKNTKIDPFQVIVYGVVSLGGNLISYFVTMFIAAYIKDQNIFPAKIRLYVLLFLVVFPLSFALSMTINFLYLKREVPSHYFPSKDKRCMLKNLLLFILPGEIIRFIIYFLSVGDITKTGVFALPATVLFEGTYQLWTKRSTLITQDKFIFADFAACFLTYAIYFALYFSCLYFIYKHYWNVGKREHDDLVIH